MNHRIYGVILCTFMSISTLDFTQDLTKGEPITFDAIDLLNMPRFDIIAKYIYALHRELRTKDSWAKTLYAAHLKVWNNFQEAEPVKMSLDDFLKSFHETLSSVKSDGFDKHKSTVPLDYSNAIINGSHRVAAALLYNKPVHCTLYPHLRAPMGTAHFFKTRENFVRGGLEEKYLDAMALQYCQLKKNTRLVVVYPTAYAREGEIKNILMHYGRIVHEKKVFFKNNGPRNLVRLLYEDEPWFGVQADNSSRVAEKAEACFPQDHRADNPMRIYVLELFNLDYEQFRACKKKIRIMFNIDPHAVHSDHRYEQTIRYAQLFFCKNSIDFINKRIDKTCHKFEKLIEQFKKWLSEQHIDPQCCCIIGDAVLAAYGKQDCEKLEFLHHGYQNKIKRGKNSDLVDANVQIGDRALIDAIIFNPEQHFYFKGLKFAMPKKHA